MTLHVIGVVTSPSPPTDAQDGSCWYNTTTERLYVKDEFHRWISVDQSGYIVDIIDPPLDPVEAYDRAMGIL